jgi:hypothetical protein
VLGFDELQESAQCPPKVGLFRVFQLREALHSATKDICKLSVLGHRELKLESRVGSRLMVCRPKC